MEASVTRGSRKAPEQLSDRLRSLYTDIFSMPKNPAASITRSSRLKESKLQEGSFDEPALFTVPEQSDVFHRSSVASQPSSAAFTIPKDFYRGSIAQRRARMLQEILADANNIIVLDGDLLAGQVPHAPLPRCWSSAESRCVSRLLGGKNGTAAQVRRAWEKGFGVFGATGGNIIPNYQRVLSKGLKQVQAEIRMQLDLLTKKERLGEKGAQYQAMLAGCSAVMALAEQYAQHCEQLANTAATDLRSQELCNLAQVLHRMPGQPPTSFWEALQTLWLLHLAVVSEAGIPGAGISFGRIDQYLYPYWEKSLADGMDRNFAKELLGCFCLHCCQTRNLYPDASEVSSDLTVSQVFTLSGSDSNGKDLTNDLTFAFLEVMDELNFPTELCVQVRLHSDSPERLLDRVSALILRPTPAPLFITFDERCAAGLFEMAQRLRCASYLDADRIFDYSCVGGDCIVPGDSIQTAAVGCSPNLLKALELTLGNGTELFSYPQHDSEKTYPAEPRSSKTGEPSAFTHFEDFYDAFKTQLRALVEHSTALYARCASLRALFYPTPMLSCLISGCQDAGKDVSQCGGVLSYITIAGLNFARTVDALLAIDYLVFERNMCTLNTLITAIRSNWDGYEELQCAAQNKAPKYGLDQMESDAMAHQVLQDFCDIVYQQDASAEGCPFVPGLAGKNIHFGAALSLPASTDGSQRCMPFTIGLSSAAPDTVVSPTVPSNSAGMVLGGTDTGGILKNILPGGGTQYIRLPEALLHDGAKVEIVRSFLLGYAKNGGTAVRILPFSNASEESETVQ